MKNLITPTRRLKVTRAQVAEVLFRTMRIEEPEATRAMAKKAAKSVRVARK